MKHPQLHLAPGEMQPRRSSTHWILIVSALIVLLICSGCDRPRSDLRPKKPDIQTLFRSWEKQPIKPYMDLGKFVLIGPGGVRDTYSINGMGWWNNPGSKLYPSYSATLGYDAMVEYPSALLEEGFPLAQNDMLSQNESDVRQPFLELRKYPNRDKIWHLRIVFRDFYAEWKLPGKIALRFQDTLDIQGHHFHHCYILPNQNTTVLVGRENHIRHLYWTAAEGLVGYETAGGGKWRLAARLGD